MDILTLSQLAGVLSVLLPLVREVLQILVLLLPRSYWMTMGYAAAGGSCSCHSRWWSPWWTCG